MKSNLEHAKKCQEWKAKKASSRKKNSTKMVTKNIKKSVKEIFETHMKTLKKCNHEDTNIDSNSENEYYRMEDVGFNLKDINASDTVALSNL